MRSLKPRFPLGLVALITLITLVYWPVRTFDFVRWDDDNNFTQNPLLTEPWSLALMKRIFAADHALRFEPVHWLCCRLVYAVGGYEPAVWHLLGYFWHLLAAVLFAVVLRGLFMRFDPQTGKCADLLALWGAAVWALHPLRAETVAWVTASTYPLTGVCLLGSFACYLRTSEPGCRRGVWLGLAWGLAVLGYGSYPVGITYGLWLIVFDLWQHREGLSQEGPRQLRWWTKHLFFILPAGVAVAITLWTRYTSPGMFTVAPDLAMVGLPTRLVMALAGITALAWGFVWPVGLSPNRIPLNLASIGPLVLVLAAALVAAVALVAAWKVRHSRAGLTLLFLGFAALSVPCLGLTEWPTWPVDRYSYLVHLIITGGLAAMAFRWKARRLGMIAAISLIIIGVEAVAARQQIMVWRNSESLFTQMAKDPRFSDNPRQQGLVYVLWGRYLAVNKSPARAADMFNRAQGIYLDAIKAAVARQDYYEAWALSTHIERYFTLTPVLHRERGVWFLRLGRRSEALTELQLAQAAMPNDARLQYFLKEAQK
jgi:hypothetical protein